MSKLQEIFDRIQTSKKEQKEIKLMYKDALSNSSEYEKVEEELRAVKLKKKKIEDAIKEDFSSEFNKLDTLKLDIENDVHLLSDASLVKLMAGEGTEIVDERGRKYNPLFSVKFKKD